MLTFANRSQFAENEWLGAGFAETLTAKLGQVEAMGLMERRRIADVLRELGDAQADADPEGARAVLGVTHLLVGSVQTSGSFRDPAAKVRVDARIVTVETGEVSSRFALSVQGVMADLFSLQTDLAARFCAALDVPISPQDLQYRDVKSLDAYRLFSLANQALDAGQYRDAISLYDEAMQANDGVFFAEAHHNQGEAYLRLASVGQEEERQQVRRDHLQRFEADAKEASAALFDLGLAYEANGLWEPALKSFEDFLTWSGGTGRYVKWKGRFDLESILPDGDRFYAQVHAGSLSTPNGSPLKNLAKEVAYETATGRVLWESEVMAAADAAAEDENALYFVGFDSEPPEVAEPVALCVYALDKANGRRLWKVRVDVPWLGKYHKPRIAISDYGPVLAAPFRPLSTTNNRPRHVMVGLDRKSGAVRWQRDGNYLLWAGVWRDQVLCVDAQATGPQVLRRLRVADGTVVSEEPFRFRLNEEVVLWEDTLFLGGLADKEVLSYGLRGGAPGKTISADCYRLRQCGETLVTFGKNGLDTGAGIRAFGLRDLAPRWQFSPRQGQPGRIRRVEVEGDRVYAAVPGQDSTPAGSMGVEIYALDGRTGEVLWTFEWNFGQYVAFRMIGQWLFLGGVEVAVVDTDSLSSFRPQNSIDARLHMARLYGELGKMQEAEALLEGILRVGQGAPEAFLQVALLREATGRHSQSVRDLVAGLRLAPEGSAIRSQIFGAVSDRLGLVHFETIGRTDKPRILSVEGDRLVLGSGQQGYGGVSVYDLGTWVVLRTISASGERAVAFGRLLFHGQNENVVAWDLETGRQLWQRPGPVKRLGQAGGGVGLAG